MNKSDNGDGNEDGISYTGTKVHIFLSLISAVVMVIYALVKTDGSLLGMVIFVRILEILEWIL